MEYILEGFILTIFIALVLNIVLAKFNIPTIIGYILTGIIISKIFSLQTENLALLTHISELGIVFMMFMIGLEFSFRYLLKIKSFVFGFGFAEVLIIGLLFSFLAYAFGLSLESALIVGFALSLSSTAIVIKMLNSSGDINSQYGIRALGILIFQDMAVIPIMLMVELFSKEGSSLAAKLFGVVVSATILLIVMYFLGRFLFEKIFTWVSKINSEELFIGSILFIVLFSSLFAHLLGFSYSLGAFVAGMLIAETRFKYQIEADIAPFRDLLLGLFFITIGMHIDPIFIFKNIYIILLLLCAIMLIKIVLIYAIVRVKTQSRTSLKVALALMQVGEFALAVFEISRNKGLLDSGLTQILIATVTLSMVLTPFILQNIKNIADLFSKEPEGTIEPQSKYNNHIIVIGYGQLGKSIVDKLKKFKTDYIILEHDYSLVQEGVSRGEPIILANAAKKETLEKAGIKSAIGIIVAIKNFKKKRLISDIINRFDFHTNTVVVVSNKMEKEIISQDLHIENIVVDNEEISNIVVDRVFRCVL